jgi:two-component system nitrogen regulation response regulator GlnG/two-component system response regulator HydG
MADATTLLSDSGSLAGGPADVDPVDALVLAWLAEEPWRVGEVAVLPEGQPQVLGRGDGLATDARVRFFRQRPGTIESTQALIEGGLSRRQVIVTATSGGLKVESIGRCQMRVNGEPCLHALLRPGDTIHLRRQLVLLYVRRPVLIPEGRHFPRESWGDFGEPDAHGILGESPATWRLRERLGFVAKGAGHTLLIGPSGTGKELAARSIHALSGRGSKPFVARNAATLPTGLIDAELFGNARNYPNAGMAERPGLIGEAAGGTLFLDEIGELPAEQQSHLLRVLDQGGEYQRLGESGARSSDFRLVGATNRDPSMLNHDLRARLTSVIELSPLSSRREDIPLLAQHLLRSAAERSPEVAGRFLARGAKGGPHARFAPAFIERLLRQNLTTNMRQVEAVLLEGMSESTGNDIQSPRQWPSEGVSSPPGGATPTPTPPPDLSVDRIRAALDAAGDNVVQAAHALGLPSRFALYRLMRKHKMRERAPE